MVPPKFRENAFKSAKSPLINYLNVIKRRLLDGLEGGVHKPDIFSLSADDENLFKYHIEMASLS
ncbi:MAG: hypothetical protein GX896_06970 [Clostridiales bacterium]|nr:hypothetical protein [Clostridiales bacterium]